MFYTYIHFKLTDNKPFYVGKGSGNRIYVKRQRSKEWQEIVKANGFRAEYYKFYTEENDAFKCEKELIANLKNKGEILCNKTSGGQGMAGAIYSDEYKNKISNGLKQYFSNPESKLKVSTQAKNRMSLDSERLKISDGLKKFYLNNPNISKINSEKAKERGLKNPNLFDHLKYLAESQRKKVFCVEYQKIFNSVSEAKSWLISIGFIKAQTGAISGACSGKRSKYLNLNWNYIN